MVPTTHLTNALGKLGHAHSLSFLLSFLKCSSFRCLSAICYTVVNIGFQMILLYDTITVDNIDVLERFYFFTGCSTIFSLLDPPPP